MILERLIVGPLENNCFVVVDEETRSAIIIDPGDEPDRILDLIKQNNYKVKYIICTHAHFDHIGGLPEIKEELGAEIVIHKDELPIYKNAHKHAESWGFMIDPLPEPDRLVNDNEILSFGKISIKIIHTPGHSPGGICIKLDDVLFTGDTLFKGSVGRTDLPGCDENDLKKSLKKIVSSMPDKVKVLPGHGPYTTIGEEKKFNLFIHSIL